MSAVLHVNGHTPQLSSDGASALGLAPDLHEAARFLAALDPAAHAFTFQIFGEGEAKTIIQPWHRSGSLDARGPELARANVDGAGIYVTVNETDGRGRKKGNIVRARAGWVDIDDDPTGAKREAILACDHPPHIVVESSPGKTHAYWIVEGLPLKQQQQLLLSICSRFGGDLNACGITRVMRLPGFDHHKTDRPFRTRIISTVQRPPYSAAEMLAAFPPLPKTTIEKANSTDVEPVVAVDESTIRDLRSALLSMRAGDRDLWIRVGCALRELGNTGRGLFMDWSSTSDKHDPAADSRTWDTLGHDRTGYRVVFAEAQRRGWVNPRSAEGPQHCNEPVRPPVWIDANSLVAFSFPPREMLLGPWLPSQSLTMIYGWRGVAKTHVALGIALALATGGTFLGWKADFPIRSLYIDGEMPGAALQERVTRAMSSSEKSVADGYLRFVTPDLQENGVMPNLADRAGQAAIEPVLGDARVIIVDNLSCLARGGKENEAEGWLPLADWSLRMRAMGRSVVFIHHAGKGGQQRGTSKREDLLDTVIALRRPNDYRAEQGARFEVHFEKARALYGQDVAPLEAMLETTADRRQVWVFKSVEAVADAQMIELAQLGLSQADIARELNCHRSTVMRALRKAESEGRYNTAAKSKGNSRLAAKSARNAVGPADITAGLRVCKPRGRNTQQNQKRHNSGAQQTRNERNDRNNK